MVAKRYDRNIEARPPVMFKSIKKLLPSHRADGEIDLLTAAVIEAGKDFARNVDFKRTGLYYDDMPTEISICLEFTCFMLHFSSRTVSNNGKAGDIVHHRMVQKIIDMFSRYFPELEYGPVKRKRSALFYDRIINRATETEKIYGKFKLMPEPNSSNFPLGSAMFAAAQEISKVAGLDGFESQLKIFADIARYTTSEIPDLSISPIELVEVIRDKLQK